MKPKELVVISGKGGTGKTSITAALAHCFARKVIADCDVDAADLHLLFQVKSYQMKAFQSGHNAEINPEKCQSCGLCFSLCRFDAIQFAQGAYHISASSCEGCRVCVDACPEHAIQWTPAKSGVTKESITDQDVLFHARLYPGAENSGKLVTHVRNSAITYAEKHEIPLLLVDGPPGIGCPVIASITGASTVLIVTEPTPSGLHDTERVLVLARHFQVPALVLINKCDLSVDYCQKIEECALRLDAKVVSRIPYSPLFTQAQIAGKSILEVFPESLESTAIRDLAVLIGAHLQLEVVK